MTSIVKCKARRHLALAFAIFLWFCMKSNLNDEFVLMFKMTSFWFYCCRILPKSYFHSLFCLADFCFSRSSVYCNSLKLPQFYHSKIQCFRCHFKSTQKSIKKCFVIGYSDIVDSIYMVRTFNAVTKIICRANQKCCIIIVSGKMHLVCCQVDVDSLNRMT